MYDGVDDDDSLLGVTNGKITPTRIGNEISSLIKVNIFLVVHGVTNPVDIIEWVIVIVQ